ncbi:MAG: AAA family ATPase [Christensenellales bacterium]|jgi:cytidylate kinase
MKGQIIVTINRQYGSGGHEIGRRLAQEMDIAFYDKELLSITAQRTGMPEDLLSLHDERLSTSSMYLIGAGAFSSEPPLNDRIFLAQFKAIKAIAQSESCVIVGRCSDYVLTEHQHSAHIYIRAPLSERIGRIADMYEVSRKKAKEVIARVDKQRDNYYQHYTQRRRDDPENYHLTIDSSALGVQGSVDTIRRFAELFRDRQIQG